jgi:uncharacterized protein YfaS (alpha-2-macroglobulin family)
VTLIPRLVLAVGVGSLLADGPPALRVLRANPTGDAPPTAAITVTFDRPVAGSLDRTVDPRGILSIQPALRGTAEWRDPVTLRFRPAAPLPANTDYIVTVGNDFAAMDGSRLPRPYRFDFRVRGPRVLTGSPVSGRGGNAQYLAPNSTFDLVLDAPADSAQLAGVYVEFGKSCPDPGVVRLRVGSQRPIGRDDRYEFKEAGGWDRDRAADSLRRVVRLVPVRPLPRGCAGELVHPSAFDARGRATLVRWPLATYGDFRLKKADCAWGRACPTGPIIVRFSTPVKGAEVVRRVKIYPSAPFSVADTGDVQADWVLNTSLRPRTTYAVVVDTALRDIFGQRFTGNTAAGTRTTGYTPSINYLFGRATVERQGLRTLAVTYVNVDTLDVTVATVPDSLLPILMARDWGWEDHWKALAAGATTRRLPVRGDRDVPRVYGVRLPAPDARVPGAPTLMAVRISSERLDSSLRRNTPIALVQVTDLGVHAKIGVDEGAVWVTGASDGKPRPNADVKLFDAKGALIATARTGADGLARLGSYHRPAAPRDTTDAGDEGEYDGGFDGWVSVTLNDDRALLAIRPYDPDLSPWQFNVSPAFGSARIPAAGAVFTERGIYRPGEPLYAKAIVRVGMLGRLAAATAGDSIRWHFADRDNEGTLRDTTTALSAFGTADQRLVIPADAKIGSYRVSTEIRRNGRWTELASTGYRIAEYRPPEFLVDVATPEGTRTGGDSISASVEARYLFGAPMGRAALTWWVYRAPLSPWELDIPNTDGFTIGETGRWWEELAEERGGAHVVASGTDTLDAAGRRSLRLPVGQAEKGRGARVTVQATVTDVNRQSVSSSSSVLVHPASFYIGAKVDGTEWFWKAGTPVTLRVIAVRPTGERVSGVRVAGVIERREWHQVRREREGYGELVGEWVTDTVARCTATTAADPAPCRFTPPLGGSYTVQLTAQDEQGRPAVTSFYRWAAGAGWVPWSDETQFKMDVIPDRTRYTVGDTATVMFASPFTGAEAWVTVEREGIIEQRRLTVESGSTTLRFPVTEAWAPNVYVSIVVARGRSAPPGPLDDPGRPTIRVGYAELRVTPERKRLAVEVAPAKKEYRPGDTARVELRVRDAAGAGQRAEVTLWAVDEGVLALTGYRTPDPIDLLYQPRGIGLRLASTLASVAPQVPEGEKGRRSPGGGGGAEGSDVLRSRFQTTAFFLGSVVTGADGRAVASAKLPDNITTFRVMAVAVTAGDRYGSGQSSMLVTRPLVARPALPRFVRPGDRFSAGVVVNQRLGGTPDVTVQATTRGLDLGKPVRQRARLEAGRGREVRFDLSAPSRLRADSVSLRFDVTGEGEKDAVQAGLPVRPAFHTRSYTVAGTLADSATAAFELPAGIDPDRSRLTLSFGTSPLVFVRGAYDRLRVYPYYCTEQVVSAAQPLIALYRVRSVFGADTGAITRLRPDIVRAVDVISRRQRADGGIGFWSPTDWTSPWLSSYAGMVLLDARAAGVTVSDSVLARLERYLRTSLSRPNVAAGPVRIWYSADTTRLSDRVAVLDYLGRAGRRDRAVENELVRKAAQLAWEDRVRLAAVLARWNDTTTARRLLEPAWASVRVEGRAAVLPPASRRDFYFYSLIRPAAWLLRATLAVDPDHPLVGPLVELLIQQGRSGSWIWNTQDYGTAVEALAEFQARHGTAAAERGLRVRSGNRLLLESAAGGPASRDSSIALTGLLETKRDGTSLHVSLDALRPGAPVYYYLTVTEVPRAQPVRPDDAGIAVERWYESYDTGKPTVSAAAGALVRVRLRVTVAAERHFVVLDDALPAGLEAVDLSLRTVGPPGPGAADTASTEAREGQDDEGWWAYGSWDAGWWSPFDHREIRDDRVVYSATILWPGTYSASYLARATTPGVFVRPPAHAEEMYNPAVYGRTDGGVFTVEAPAR